MKAMKVNNYKELSNAVKKLFVDFICRNNNEINYDYCNNFLTEEQIISMTYCGEWLQEFVDEHPMIFQKQVNFKKFFKKISCGHMIKCNFPAIVFDDGIIELKEIIEPEKYTLLSKEDFNEEQFSIKEIEHFMKKEMFIYIGIESGIICPIKKSKEELLEYIKNKRISFIKQYNYDTNKFLYGVGENNIVISKRPINKFIEERISRII
jgi:hypothetical protein